MAIRLGADNPGGTDVSGAASAVIDDEGLTQCFAQPLG